MGLLVGYWPALVAGLLLIGVAAWLGAVRAGRAERAVALLLAMMGLSYLVVAFGDDDAQFPGLLRIYADIGVVFASVNLGLRLLARPAVADRALWVLASLACLCMAAFARDHTLLRADGVPGPFFLFRSLSWLSLAGLAVACAVAAKRDRRLDSVAVGLSLPPSFACAYSLFSWVACWRGGLGCSATPREVLQGYLDAPWWAADQLLYVVTWLMLVVLGVVLSRRGVGGVKTAGVAAHAIGLVAAAALVRRVANGSESPIAWAVFFGALFTFAAAAILVAAVRRGLIVAPAHVKTAFQGAFVVPLMVAVVFAIGELVIAAVQKKSGSIYLGVGVAAVLIFLLAPAQQALGRLGSAVPRAGPLPQGSGLQIYEEEVELAWQDGALGRKEFQMLARLQERLGIADVEAREIESAVLRKL